MIADAFKNVHKQSTKNQYLAALVANSLYMINYGCSSGWASPSIILLTSDESPLPSDKITMEQASWLAALLPLGGLFGNIMFGFVMERFGRKRPLICLSIPIIKSWLLILFAQNVNYLYVARALHGINVGSCLQLIPAFLIEISNDDNRGIISSSALLIGHLGLLFEFLMGTYCSFNVPPIFMIVITIVFVSLFSFYPETPWFLMKQNQILEAEKSIRFYQNIRDGENNDLVQLEMEKLKRAIEGSESKHRDNKSLNWSDLTTNPGKKSMIIGTFLAFSTQFSGCFTMMSYAANIFKEAGSNLSPNMSAIVLGLIQFFGSFVIIFLVDRAGRKFLYIISMFGAALGYVTLGTYILLDSWHYNVEAYNFIPIFSLSFVIFIGSLGITSLPFTVITELMPEQLKNFGVAFCLAFMSICTFIIVKSLPSLANLMGLHGCVFLFAGVCLVSAVFIIGFMPETKGKSYEEIMNALK